MNDTSLHILSCSGSLRARSSNTELLRAAALAAPTNISVEMYGGIGMLPHFNPDVEEAVLPATVIELRHAIAVANALIISTPEYAHGVPGSLKNALDWLVGGPEMIGKRVAVWHATTWSAHAPAQLEEILRTMSADVITEASVTINLRGKQLVAEDIVRDAPHRAAMVAALQRLLGI